MSFVNGDLSHSVFKNCCFDGCDLSGAACEYSDFTGSSFRDSNLYRTSFKASKLACVVFEPKDAYGITFTLECSTFENMQISQLWWFAWVMFAAKMLPTVGPIRENLHDKLVGMIGAERYVKLIELFRRREV